MTTPLFALSEDIPTAESDPRSAPEPTPPVEPGLLLRLAGPLQSWGEHSHYPGDRDTAAFPTRSGVIGLLACALGRPRGHRHDDLRQLRLTVRVDRPGTLLRDLHTVGGGLPPEETVRTAKGGRRLENKTTVYGHRTYLADATFVCAITLASDETKGSVGHGGAGVPEQGATLLRRCARALAAPQWPLYLGRRACPPEGPLLLRHSPDALGDLLRCPLPGRPPQSPAVSLLADRPLHWLPRHSQDPDDGSQPSSEVQDEPVDTGPDQRTYRTRHLYRGTWHPPHDQYTGHFGTAYLQQLAVYLEGASEANPTPEVDDSEGS